MGKYKDWKEYFKEKNKYSDNDSFEGYDLIWKYLPEYEKAVIIDVGCGKTCDFETYFELWNKYTNLVLLELNENTINKIKLDHTNTKVLKYCAPERTPFDDKTIDFIYCSHMIEHLNFIDVYNLLKEFNRILKPTGILVIRSPLLWYAFYETIDHIKPYPPLMLKQYLCGSNVDSPSYELISKDYEVKELAYRYSKFSSNNNKIGSSNMLIDFLIQIGNLFIRKILKIKRYKQTAYTMILKKCK